MSGPRGYTTLKGKEPQLRYAMSAIEYDSGELYFDRVGRVVREIAARGTGWVRQAEIAANKSTIVNPSSDLVAEITPSGCNVTLTREVRAEIIEPEEITVLIDEAAAVLAIVRDELEIESLQRVDYRERYLFPCDSVDDAEKWVTDLGLMKVAPSVYQTFGNEHYALSWVVVVVGEECRYRIEVKGTERPVRFRVGTGELSVPESHAKRRGKKEILELLKKKRERQFDPEYGAVFDIDAFLWQDIDLEFDMKQFASKRATTNLTMLRDCLEIKPQKR